MPGPEGKLGHAEVKIGDSKIMLSDEYEPMNFLSPQARGGTSVHIHLYVKDVDATVARDGPGRVGGAAGAGPVLRRSQRLDRGPARAPVARRHAQGGSLEGRAEEARRAGGEAGGRLKPGPRGLVTTMC